MGSRGKSVGAIIRKGDEVLMLDRMVHPIGWAGPAGHLDEGEDPEAKIHQEVKEEIGVDIKKIELVWHGVVAENECIRGHESHEWWVYSVLGFEGEPQRLEPKNHRSVTWKTIAEVPKLILDPAWREIFQKLQIIPQNNL